MINDKLIYCKIDRVDGIITFRRKRTENESIDDWNDDVNKILSLINNTSNLIKREEEKYVDQN